ncbi:MAG TPA: flavin reductase family protein [Anaeromyxobacteraceae bacterium]|nr:flavin reductase family protein [Anaeromyxobacteraceae bacterium]
MKGEQFTEVLRKLPLVVTVVTVGRGGVENGLTVSWIAPASFEPPQLMFAVDKLHYSVDFLRSTRNFAVNVLREGQQKIAGHFARQAMAGEDKLGAVKTREGGTGAAIFADALAWFDCELSAVHEAGDHLVVVGKVVDAGVQGEGAPLTTVAAGMQYRKFRPAS